MSTGVPDEATPKSPKVFAWISILSEDRSAEEISTLIGLQPDRAWMIGDRRGKTNIIERTHGWILNSRLKDIGFDVEMHIDDLLQRVKPIAERFALLAETDVVTVHTAIYSDSRVLMSFEPRIQKLIGELHARFDIEIYFLPPQEE